MRLSILLAALALSGCAAVPEPVSHPPASVAVVFDADEVRPVIVEGLANRETGRPVEANDPVRVASISKMVMAMAAYELAAEGKLDLGTDVSEYLGYTVRNPAYPDVPVTVPQILMHRSGLRDRTGYVIPLGESLQAKLAQPDAWYTGAPPGEAPFEYANLGSPVVATVLEAASGERYDQLVHRLVFAPLGITSACFNWIDCDRTTMERAVTLYRATGEVARDAPEDVMPPACTFPVFGLEECRIENYVPGTNASIFSPQGGLRIGMLDLAKLGQAWLVQAPELALSELTYGEMLFSMMAGPKDQEFFCGYGAAMQLIEVPNHSCNDTLVGDGRPRFGHAGEAYGLRSGLWIDAQGGQSIAYFVTQVPDRTRPDEGGFAAEEIALVARAFEAVE